MSCERLGSFVGSFYPTWDRSEFFRLLEIFEIPRSRKVSQLSGGMKAKLALALAITPKPKLLILDEPTAGLDPVARRDFLDIIASQARTYQRTTFFSSHLIDEVERCADSCVAGAAITRYGIDRVIIPGGHIPGLRRLKES